MNDVILVDFESGEHLGEVQSSFIPEQCEFLMWMDRKYSVMGRHLNCDTLKVHVYLKLVL